MLLKGQFSGQSFRILQCSSWLRWPLTSLTWFRPHSPPRHIPIRGLCRRCASAGNALRPGPHSPPLTFIASRSKGHLGREACCPTRRPWSLSPPFLEAVVLLPLLTVCVFTVGLTALKQHGPRKDFVTIPPAPWTQANTHQIHRNISPWCVSLKGGILTESRKDQTENEQTQQGRKLLDKLWHFV